MLYALQAACQVSMASGFASIPSVHINQQQYHHHRRHQQLQLHSQQQSQQLQLSQQQQQPHQQQQQSNQATLPKINLYINKQETWKLLGE